MKNEKNLLLHGEESERLYFRKVRPSDFEQWLPFYNDPNSTKYWSGLPQDAKVACHQQFDRIFERYEKRLGGMNALILKSTQQFVGICGLLLQNVDNVEELEIGYSLLPEYRKLGLATEAAQRCKSFVLEHKLRDSLISIIHVDNIPSQKVAQKNGMSLDFSTTYKDNPVHIFRVVL